MGLQKPIATAIATATPIPIPMIATQSEHDLRPDPHFCLIKCPPVYELISNTIVNDHGQIHRHANVLRGMATTYQSVHWLVDVRHKIPGIAATNQK